MNNRSEITQESEALRQRIAQLSSAILRINASLEVGAVLQEAVDSARVLTGARYGIITTIGESGEIQDFFSSGLTDEVLRQLKQWPDSTQLFEHFRDLPGVIRLADLPDYVRSLGYSDELIWSKTFQSTPMRHWTCT